VRTIVRVLLLSLLVVIPISTHATTWYIRTDGGTANRVDTGITFSVSHLFEILANDATGAYTFKIDGVSVCSSPITTDAPAASTAVYPQWGGENLTAVNIYFLMTFWGIESLQ
jgi:hypothetical protein